MEKKEGKNEKSNFVLLRKFFFIFFSPLNTVFIVVIILKKENYEQYFFSFVYDSKCNILVRHFGKILIA